ncbi:DUF2293 domain-containing protein [Planctomicrobium sp. SH668]|uniref:DUF2293 domain-containing protein n=1 Tax=Planctomicrobium sp. SH668 TaxID=3448126 RepID=UPI003F5C8397
MPDQNRIVTPGPNDKTVILPNGEFLAVPEGWIVLPPGDAALTRRVKAAGPTWAAQKKKGRKIFSLGIWAPVERIEAIRQQLEAERSTPAFAKRQASNAVRREKKQSEYVEDFRGAVLSFLNFAPLYRDQCEQLATAVTDLATPVGSGTVARTERIPIEQRAESAVIAWLRHQTTGYDNMPIPRIKGKRREVRRILATHSRTLLERYRSGAKIDFENCPLQIALKRLAAEQSQSE